MDSLVRTRDSTRCTLWPHYWPTTGPLGGPLDTHYGPAMDARGTPLGRHKISKAERTPMAHRERTGIALAPHRAHRGHAVPRTGIGIG